MTERLRIGHLNCKLSTGLGALCIVLLAAGCSSKLLKAEKSEEILRNTEFEKEIAVKEIPADDLRAQASGTYVVLPGPDPVPEAWATKSNSKKAVRGGKTTKTMEAASASAVESVIDSANTMHQPTIEDGEGFIGRRPVKDPFRVGEKTTFEVSYFAVVAGEMTLETRSFVNVNGRKSYHFVGTAKSSSVFEMFYAVDDWFETFLDFNTLVPNSYSLHVKETKQLRETRTIFDTRAGVAKFWDKKINEEKKLEERQYEWAIPAFSQNVFSIGYYLRTFTLEPGKKIQIRVAHEKENLILTCEVLRREKISTAAGEFDTVLVKPIIALNGVFKPVGDIFVWLTDDDRKHIVRLESRIKIGKIVAVATKVEPGRE